MTWSGHLTRVSGRIAGTLSDSDGWTLDLTAFRRTARFESECFGLWLRGDLASAAPVDDGLRSALAQARVITGQIDRTPDGTWLGSLVQGPHALAVTGRATGEHRIELASVELPAKHQIWFERQVEHLHACGPRPLAELLLELVQVGGTLPRLEALLDDYTRFPPAMMQALGASQFPRPPLRQVPPELTRGAA